MPNPYWSIVVASARELVDHADAAGYEFVGTNQARAIVEADEELTWLRKIVDQPRDYCEVEDTE